MSSSALRSAAKRFIPASVRNFVRRRTDTFKQRARLDSAATTPFDYDAAVDWLVAHGCDRIVQVLPGSMPPSSLAFGWNLISSELKPGLSKGLHIGNFVGISLAYFTHAAVQRDPGSIMVSIDPNISHRNIERPMEKALALLSRFGLENHSLVLTGYSLEKSRANDGLLEYAPGQEVVPDLFSSDPSCGQQLRSLATLCPAAFDFAVIDGNHEGDYLNRELSLVNTLLRVGGMIILDDVAWPELKVVYEQIDESHYRKMGADGRIGVLQKVR